MGPLQAGTLTGGFTTVDTSGYIYLTDKLCGFIRVTYYKGDHVELGRDESALHCAPGSGKTQWFVSETFTNQFVDHAHVEIIRSTGSVAGSDWATFD